jgi:hypothetical protein
VNGVEDAAKEALRVQAQLMKNELDTLEAQDHIKFAEEVHEKQLGGDMKPDMSGRAAGNDTIRTRDGHILGKKVEPAQSPHEARSSIKQ